MSHKPHIKNVTEVMLGRKEERYEMTFSSVPPSEVDSQRVETTLLQERPTCLLSVCRKPRLRDEPVREEDEEAHASLNAKLGDLPCLDDETQESDAKCGEVLLEHSVTCGQL